MGDQNTTFSAVILAAGQGTRMKSATPKSLHPVLGWPMVAYVIEAAKEAGCSKVVVVEGPGTPISAALGEDHDFVSVVQHEAKGTGDAVHVALDATEGTDAVVILNGDMPCIESDEVAALLDLFESGGMVFGSGRVEDPTGYGRVVRSDSGAVSAIREHRDCSDSELAINEVNLGIYAADRALLVDYLPRLGTNNDQGELYLTDLVSMSHGDGRKVETLCFEDWSNLRGVNDRVQLAEADAALTQRVLENLMREGVSVVDPARTRVEACVQIGRDTVLEPEVSLRGNTRIGEGCHIGQGSVITESKLGNNVTLHPYCVVEQGTFEEGVQAGPFARIRPGSVLRKGSKVGNFVEMKKTDLGPGSKANHLTYLGDSTIGEGVNVGAGTITCNYDGKNKFQTVLKDGVFIGSDVQLVAPVTVGEGAYVGAGTTVTEDVPDGALATSRTEQKNNEGWVARKKARQAKEDS